MSLDRLCILHKLFINDVAPAFTGIAGTASADHRILMPASMLAGAALLLVCDLVAKLLALPINTITALMGIPVVIYVVVRNRNIF